MDGAGETFCFVLVTAGADLLDWSILDALSEAGRGDATIGHDTLEFTRSAASRDQALCSALRDVESVAGVPVVRIELGEGWAERAWRAHSSNPA
ncbi:hypothetical protein [Candidatus Poriferisodalis sp.]|uniref:hypothetical protein n=1 Tax=Candidatus Poriferisodalis sp. TaxID=3101277 RepID=UPI003B019BF4